MIASFTVANLAALNWRLAFLIYLVAVLVLVLNVLYLPGDRAAAEKACSQKEKLPFNWKAWLVISGMMPVNVAFYMFSTSIALFLKSENIGNDATSGYTVSAFMAAGFFMGFAVPKVRELLGYFTVSLGCLMMGSGYLGLAVFDNFLLIVLSSAMIGASYSIIYASVFFKDLLFVQRRRRKYKACYVYDCRDVLRSDHICICIADCGSRFQYEWIPLSVLLSRRGAGVVCGGLRSGICGESRKSGCCRVETQMKALRRGGEAF